MATPRKSKKKAVPAEAPIKTNSPEVQAEIDAIVAVRTLVLQAISAMQTVKTTYDIDISFNIAPNEAGELGIQNFKGTKVYQ